MGGGRDDAFGPMDLILPGSTIVSREIKGALKGPEIPEAPELTLPPANKAAQQVSRKRRRGAALDFTQLGTILTGPQGASLLRVQDQPERRTLLGE